MDVSLSRTSPAYELLGQGTRANGRLMITLLIVILVLFALGAVPAWPHSRDWGYYPSGLLGVILIIVVILAVTGRL